MTFQTEMRPKAKLATLAHAPKLFLKRGTVILAHLAELARTCRRSYRAAITYEELCRLSDAELARRGLDRATLDQAVRDSLKPA